MPITDQTFTRKIKNKIYKLGKILRDNTISVRILYLISDKSEVLKNYLKLKIKASKSTNKSFLQTTKDDVMFYRMTHIDRGFWTYNDEKYLEVKDGLNQSTEYIKKLFTLLNKNKIDAHLIIYPWPTQIEFGDEKHLNYWKKFSETENINFINLYDIFQTKNSRETIFENFIYGDIHWNKKGTIKVFNQIIKKISF